MPKASAIFDTLYIIKQTKMQCSGLSVSELNFLSYFACLLSLYHGHPVSDWGYDFLSSELGAPISADIFDSCQMLNNKGELIKQEIVFNITLQGENRLNFFLGLEEFKSRTLYIDAACNCLLIDSILNVQSTISRDAIITESSVHKLKYLNNADNSAISMLYQQFGVIKKAIGNRTNLFIPATSWLLYLRQNQEAL